MIEFVLGRSGSGKSTYLYSLAENYDGEVCLLVPEQESMTAERLCQQKYGDRVQVLSFRRLGDHLMRLYGGGARAKIGDVARLGILYQAVQNVRGQLKYYHKSIRSVRFYEKLVPVMEDFAAYRVSSDMVLHLINRPEIHAKYQDLFLIYDSFNALRQVEYRDHFDDLETVAELLRNHPFFEKKLVLVDSFAGFTQQEYAIFESVFLQADSVVLTLSADENDVSLFAPTLQHLRRLEQLADTMGLAHKRKRLCGQYRLSSDNLKVLERYLFSSKRPGKAVSPDGSVRMYSALGVEDEVRFVAADIRKRVLSGECRYKDISVVSNVQDEYRYFVESIFDELEIPLFTDRKVNVLSKPLFSMILYAFDCVQYGYRFEDMIAFAKTYLCGLDHEQVARLENYVYIWNIRGDQWKNEWTRSPFGLDEGDEDKKAEQLAQLNQFRLTLIEPLEEFAEDTKSGNTKEMLTALWNLLENFDVAETIQKYASESKTKEQKETWLRLYELLIDILDQLALVLGDGQITRKQLHDMMEVCLRGYRFGVVPAYMDQVHFGDMIRAHSGEVRHLYVLGAAAGKFPSGVSGSNIITDRDIRMFKEQDVLLSKDSVTVATEQQLCLYRSVVSASDSVTFSYSYLSASGEALLPSALLDRISSKLIDMPVERVKLPLTHWKDVLRELMLLSPAHPQYQTMKSFLKQQHHIDVDDYYTRKKDEKNLPRKTVEALYGKELSASQSRIERFVECPFGFFLQYGIKLQETKPAVFEANYIGSFVHSGMETLLNAIADEGDINAWNDARVDDLLDEVAQKYYGKEFSDLASPRFNHIFDRICRTMHMVGHSVVDELRHSRFVPKEQEFHFKTTIPLSQEFYAKINGFVDRIDVGEVDGQKWLKIIDYKTGNKEFSIQKIYNGYQLQLPLYSKMLREDSTFFDHKVAGMEYLIANVPRFDDLSEGVYHQKLAAAFERRGIYVADKDVVTAMDNTPENMYSKISFTKSGTFGVRAPVISDGDMELLCEFARKKTVEVMEQIISGDVSVSPIKETTLDACAFCKYHSICRYETGKNSCRKLKKITPEQLFEEMREEAEQ